MSTRKVKDAIDLETNEVIYLKGHAKATFMSDGRTVEDAINQAGTGGGSGGEVYIGEEEPTSDAVEIWIDESEEGVSPESSIDTEMSDVSTNAVQNRVIKGYVDNVLGNINTILDNINGEGI